MSNKNWNTQQTTQRLEKLELQNSIKVVIPNTVRDKIKFLCKKIAKEEWSGVLFYSVEGDIRNSSKMVITLEDIFLMDKGTNTFTSFDYDEAIVEYRMDNPESLDWIMGHIHSHNTMGVFFSGTDMEELNDNCVNHNFYLSVIVNNYLDVTAKIAMAAQSQSYTCKDKNGKDFQLKITNTNSKPIMLLYNCEIIMEHQDIIVPDSFSGRLDTIIKQAEEKAAKSKLQQGHIIKTHYNDDWGKGYSKTSKTADIKNPVLKTDKPYYLELIDKPESKKIHSLTDKEFENSQLIGGREKDENEFHVTQTIDQEFAAFVLRLGNSVEDDELEEAIEDIEISGVNMKSLISSIQDCYPAYYDKFFEKLSAYHNDVSFLYVTEKVIEALEAHQDNYEFLDGIINTVKEIGNKYESNLKKETV